MEEEEEEKEKTCINDNCLRRNFAFYFVFVTFQHENLTKGVGLNLYVFSDYIATMKKKKRFLF